MFVVVYFCGKIKICFQTKKLMKKMKIKNRNHGITKNMLKSIVCTADLLCMIHICIDLANCQLYAANWDCGVDRRRRYCPVYECSLSLFVVIYGLRLLSSGFYKMLTCRVPFGILFNLCRIELCRFSYNMLWLLIKDPNIVSSYMRHFLSWNLTTILNQIPFTACIKGRH